MKLHYSREYGSIRRAFILVIFLAVTGISVQSFSFSPMTVSITPSGSGAVITYRVSNESDLQTAVSIKVATRVIDPLGKETMEPADKLFLVFPSRVVLKPNSSQNIKVQYRGNPSITSEAAYRIIAEQLPVDFSKSTSSGVSILLTYVAALYVTPKNAVPKLLLFQAIGAQKDGVQGIEVTVKNEGTRHALVANPVIRIHRGEASSLEFSGEAAGGIDGQNILALSERKIFLPWDAAVTGVSYEGAFDAEIE